MEPPPAHSDNNSHDEQGGNDIFIGTAGYSYAHWRQGVFYPLGVTQLQELRHYSGVFSAVEINASFHAVPREETLLKWAKNAKPGFLFSFKVPQAITHEKRLENIEQALDYFLTRLLKMSGIRPCLGPILFQLPPSLPKDISKLDRLSRLIPKGIRVAFEFRNKTWYCSDVYDAMRRYGFGLCDNISPDESKLRVAGSNIEAATTAKVWHYIRCHKRANQQITDYTKEQLIKIADQLVERRNRNIAQYCFFLNDHEGNGPRNAKTLLNLIKERSGNTQGLVQKWKSDPVAPSVSSMFAKSNATSANKAATSTTATTQSPLLQTVSKAKKTPRSIDSFFSPSNDKITPPSITKRRKTSADGPGDQVSALQWIQKHIASFGGDPQSSGSVSTCTLLHTPATKGLFHRVILQSGTCYPSLDYTLPKEDALAIREKYPDSLYNSTSDHLDLETAPAEDILNRVDVLVGTTSFDQTVSTIAVGRNAFLSDFGITSSVEYSYSTDDDANLFLDACLRCQSQRVLQRVVTEGGGAGYWYTYDCPHDAAPHGSDNLVVFGNVDDSAFGSNGVQFFIGPRPSEELIE